MDNWDTSVIYDLATTRHAEQVARGAAAQHVTAILGARPARARLAAALAALATRLDPPATTIAPREVGPLATTHPA